MAWATARANSGRVEATSELLIVGHLLQAVALGCLLTHILPLDLERLTSTMSSGDRQVTTLRETVLSTRSRFITEFDNVDESSIHNMTIERFLDYVERQRLTYMPHRGSRWDKVLKWTEYFALQISGYAKAIESFVLDSDIAAKLIWTACCALLEVMSYPWHVGLC